MNPRYQDLINNLPVGVYRTTSQGSIIDCNQTLVAMLGYEDIEELRKINVNDLYLDKNDRSQHLLQLAKVKIQFREFQLKRKDGQPIWVRDFPRAVRDEKSALQYYDGIIIDISERKRAEQALIQSERDYRELFEYAHDAIIIFAVEQEIVLNVNQRACELYGFEKHEFQGMSLEEISKDVQGGKKRIARVIRDKVYHNFETVHFKKDGTEMVLDVNSAIIQYKGQEAILSINRDITEKKQLEEKIRQMAFYDSLTNLPNRKLMEDRLFQALLQCERKGENLTLVFLDLDGFKQINDTYGHQTGDELLRQAANRFSESIRKSDTVSRWAGDEFVIILKNITSEEDIKIIIEKLLDSANQKFSIFGNQLTLTSSIGIARYPEDGDTANELIKHADMAMYKAKQEGKNRYCFYNPALGSMTRPL